MLECFVGGNGLKVEENNEKRFLKGPLLNICCFLSRFLEILTILCTK